MDKVKGIYKEAYRQFGNSASAVCWPKGRQDLRFDRLITNFPENSGSLLDYGCGLAHFHDYASSRKLNYQYFGVELVEEFLNDCRKRLPEAPFFNLQEFQSSQSFYDYVICSGTFNIKYFDDNQENDKFFKEMISQLFSRTRRCLSLNLMTDKVDFQQPGAWHVNPGQFISFVSQNLSSRFVLDSSYMPYEFTVTIFKDDGIKRPENVFNI